MSLRFPNNAGSSHFLRERISGFRAVVLVLATFQITTAGCVSSRPAIVKTGNLTAPAVPLSYRSKSFSVDRSRRVRLVINSNDVVKPEPISTRLPFEQITQSADVLPIDLQPFYDPAVTSDSYFLLEPQTDGLLPLATRRLTFREDFHALPGRFLDEIDSLATLENAVFLGTAGGIAAVLHNNVDARVAQHQPISGSVSDVITDFGTAFPVQLPLLGVMYVTSLCRQDDDLHELTLTMFTTYKFTLLSSVALQYATRTHHSSNGVWNLFADNGFPSQQTATTFAMAAVVDEAFGWKGGLPAYAFASVIAWAEVDQNQHTVSDVVFGAALGFAIGKSIGALHYRPDAPCKLVPLIDAYSGTQGLGIEFAY